MKENYLYLTSIIFLIVGIVHLFKILSGFSIVIAGVPYPLWISWAEMILAFGFAFLGFRFARG
jgi:TRAP-type C4-dicarboxylate transport system permease small subunit